MYCQANFEPPSLQRNKTSMNNKLLTLFNALSIDEQKIMLALAVIYAPISQSNLQGLLAKSSGFELKTIRLIDKSLREKLQKARIIGYYPGWLAL